MYSLQKLEAKCYSRALSYIALKQRTEKEVSDKLETLLKKYIDKEYVTSEIAWEAHKNVMEQLRSEKLLNDVKYAELYVQQSKSKSNPSSKMEINAFLSRKGVARNVISEALLTYSEEEEESNILRLVQKRIKDPQILTNPSIKNKHLNYFFRKGFSGHLVRKVFDSLI